MIESPQPRTRNCSTGWTPARRDAFLEALAELGSAERACHRVGLSASSAFRLRRQPRGADFAAAWDAVLAVRSMQLKEELRARVRGTPQPTYYRGRVIGQKVDANNRLLLGVLKRTMTRNDAPPGCPEDALYDAMERLLALKFNEIGLSATFP